MDSTTLYSLANQCPYSGGGVVYQARALYNAVYNTYQKFSDNCNVALGSRLFDNVVKPEEVKEINVVLQSKLFPNPNPGAFTIELSTKTDELTEVLVYDINGKLVVTKSFKGQTQLQLTTDLAKGTYLVKVMQSNKTFDVHRLVIE
ncbi:MAG: T9SS type A sorting domain-containing protein [Sediminibacterium sp.]|nr:T9SS type A sorting domain-containing protein [Sediminibacterium sp.]